MFTGIIEKQGRVLSFDAGAGGRRLFIELTDWQDSLQPGQSLAVNGVCLTVAEFEAGRCGLDVVPETLRRTTLADLRAGAVVNLERAVAAGGRFDGHFVQGHVDAVAHVQRVLTDRDEHLVWFEHDGACTPLIVPKGSIAVDGVSLTIAEVRPGKFSVALIPATLARTTLGDLRPGRRVNLETDLMARAILHQLTELRRGAQDADLQQLFVHGGSS
jgi:riboflavin synthase